MVLVTAVVVLDDVELVAVPLLAPDVVLVLVAPPTWFTSCIRGTYACTYEKKPAAERSEKNSTISTMQRNKHPAKPLPH